MPQNTLLVVVDMQNDFIDGSLGSWQARAIVQNVCKKIHDYDSAGIIVATQDTHSSDYPDTREGKQLPIEHCISGTSGWKIHDDVLAELMEKPNCHFIAKESFGSMNLGTLAALWGVGSVEIVGLCTDICVISNAVILRAALPEADIVVDANCCAGATVLGHHVALEAMKNLGIKVTGLSNENDKSDE